MDREAQQAYYRATAEKLRQIADALTYDIRKRDQLRALAAGFERAADRMASEAEPSGQV